MSEKIDFSAMPTEEENPKSHNLDQMTSLEMLRLMNEEDRRVPLAIEKELPAIARGVDLIVEAVKKGGRLIYIGAGTSGRLGILDASECPPTYGTDPSLVIPVMAGGFEAIFHAAEAAEDSKESGRLDLEALSFSAKDILVGLAASGRTPYVIGALEYAKSLGAHTISVTCSPKSEIAQLAELSIAPLVGPEVVTGSTRMKAATAQKLILNMLSTSLMIQIGKVFGNRMVDVKASNEKLRQRQVRIVSQATAASYQRSEEALEACQRHCKTAIFMILADLPAEEARRVLSEHHGFIRKALVALGR